MKHACVKRSLNLMTSFALFLLLAPGSMNTVVAEDKSNTDRVEDATPAEVVDKLKTELKLSPKQVDKLTSELTEFLNKLDSLIEKQKAAGEDDDPHKFIKDVKRAQDRFQRDMRRILTHDQWKQYEALKEKAIMDAMKDLAYIKLVDIQPHVGFSDEQMDKLVPVLTESMRGFIKIAWKYAGERRIRVMQKIRIARQLKEIQHKSQKQVQAILTADQLKKWDAYKQQQQARHK